MKKRWASMDAEALASRDWRTVIGLGCRSVITFAFLAGCGAEFSTCADTRSCVQDSAGGEAGAPASAEAGAPNGGAGGSDASAGCATECKDSETCCDGECVDTSSDSENCGSCGAICKVDHGDAACVDSECSVARCENGFVDCGGYADGCETKDRGLPGAPPTTLPMAGAYTGTVHAESSLKPTFKWAVPEKLGTCSALTYELELTRECEAGALNECAFEDPEVREVGLQQPEWTPSEPLPVSKVVPVGALYAWRVRACDMPERCSEWSRVSYVNVGRLIDDINADGYSDLVEVGKDGTIGGMLFVGDGATPLAASTPLGTDLGSPDEGRFLGDVNGDEFPDMLLWGSWDTSEPPRVILGGSSPLDWSIITMPAPLKRHHRGSRAGDLDGDGYADVALSEFELASEGASPQGIVRVYRGHPSFSLSAAVSLLAPEGTTAAQFGAALAGGFDSNADGFADLFILDDDDGLIHALRGANSLSSTLAGSIDAPALVNAQPGRPSELLALGDRNRDGYGDLAAYAYNVDEKFNASVIQIFHGGRELAPEPTTELVLDTDYGLSWVAGYDVGADGRPDLFLCPRNVFDYDLGDHGPLLALPGSSEQQTESDLVQVGNFKELRAGGDYDGDGVIDLVAILGLQHRLLRGGKSAPTSPTCPQPAASFPQIGDWCSVESSIFTAAAPYETYNRGVPLQ